MLLLDSGSEDETVKLAQALGARVYFRDFDNYRAQKQAALDLCETEWILSLDADEWLSAELQVFLQDRRFLEQRFGGALGFSFPRLNLFQGKAIRGCGLYPDRKLRLFRRDSGRFTGSGIHELIAVDGEEQALNLKILHEPWANLEIFQTKQDKYAKQVAEGRFALAGRADLLEAYWQGLFNFCLRYFFRLGFLDGWLGLKLCWGFARATYQKYIHLRTLSKGEKTSYPRSLLLRRLLKPIQGIYGLIVSLKERFTKKTSVPACVVCIGNLSVGGSGKTEVLMNLAKYLLADELKAEELVILSRGYGGKAKLTEPKVLETDKPENALFYGDEPALIAKTLAPVPVCVFPDRVKAATALSARYKLILLDDGFQHLALARNINICLLDCADRFGVELLPLGSLRESFGALARAQIVVLTRPEASEIRRRFLLEQVAKYAPNAKVFELKAELDGFKRLSNQERVNPAALHGKKLSAFCALGNPGQFYSSLERAKLQTISSISYPDHHRYIPSDLETLAAENDFLICTAKDAIKLGAEQFAFCQQKILIAEQSLDIEGLGAYVSDLLRFYIREDRLPGLKP